MAALALTSPLAAEEIPPPENADLTERLSAREEARRDFLAGRLDAGEARLRELSQSRGSTLRQELFFNRQVLELALQLPVEGGHGPTSEELGWRILERSQPLQEALLALPEEIIIETSSGDINAAELLWSQYYETLGLALEFLIGDWEEAMVFYEAATQLEAPAATARKRLAALEHRERAMIWKQLERED